VLNADLAARAVDDQPACGRGNAGIEQTRRRR
jgi:hypothetical protein